MKYIIFIFAFFLCAQVDAQENLIYNPNFEDGTLPNGIGQIHKATYWNKGCGENTSGIVGSPILFDEDQEDDGFFCRLDVPANGYFLNLPGKIGNRYASVFGHGSEYDQWPLHYGASLLATLKEPLTNACAYTFKIHVANRQRNYLWGGMQGSCTGEGFPSEWEYVDINPNKTLDIVLRKEGNCEDGLTVLSIDLDNNVNWSTYEGTFTLSTMDIAEGYDRLEIRRGEVSEALHVVCDAISLKVDQSATDLDPSFTGLTQFCAGDALTFVGDDGPGIAQYTFWEIKETNQFGVPVEGGYNWYSWFPGEPGTFTFPAEVDPPCNRYYWIKMAVNNPCTAWEETVQIIHIGCNPKVPKAGTVTVCRGECITLADGYPQYPGVTYQWFSDGMEVQNYNQMPLEVCPNGPESYWLLATNNATGCASTTFFVVNIENLDASWSHYEDTSVSPDYYNISAFGNDLDTETIPGFGYAWKIEKLNNDLEPVCEVYNPSCWWTHPLPTKFKSYNGSCIAGCSSNQAGRFYYNRFYRITRGVWSDACSWQQQAKIFYSEDPRVAGERPRIVVSEVEIPSMEYQLKSKAEMETDGLEFSIFPNPSINGIFNIKLNTSHLINDFVDIEIMNVSGKIIHQQKLAVEDIVNINSATNWPAGVYFVKITDGKQYLTKRLIVQ